MASSQLLVKADRSHQAALLSGEKGEEEEEEAEWFLSWKSERIWFEVSICLVLGHQPNMSLLLFWIALFSS